MRFGKEEKLFSKLHTVDLLNLNINLISKVIAELELKNGLKTIRRCTLDQMNTKTMAILGFS